MEILKLYNALVKHLTSLLVLASESIALLLAMEKNNTVQSLAPRGQLDGLKDEYSQCKREDASKYALIEVRTTPSFSPHTLTSSETPRQT